MRPLTQVLCNVLLPLPEQYIQYFLRESEKKNKHVCHSAFLADLEKWKINHVGLAASKNTSKENLHIKKKDNKISTSWASLSVSCGVLEYPASRCQHTVNCPCPFQQQPTYQGCCWLQQRPPRAVVHPLHSEHLEVILTLYQDLYKSTFNSMQDY